MQRGLETRLHPELSHTSGASLDIWQEMVKNNIFLCVQGVLGTLGLGGVQKQLRKFPVYQAPHLLSLTVASHTRSHIDTIAPGVSSVLKK